MITATREMRDRFCANCGASAPDHYCPECGQNTRDRLPTFAQFMREATGRYLSFDGKLWKTLFPLLFRPGFLTRAYLAGRRRRYIGPARLFLVSSLVLFAVLRFASESIDVDNVIQTVPPDPAAGTKAVPKVATKEEHKAAADDLIVLDDNLNLVVGNLPESMGPVKKRVERFNQLPRGLKIEQILGGHCATARMRCSYCCRRLPPS